MNTAGISLFQKYLTVKQLRLKILYVTVFKCIEFIETGAPL